MFDWLNHLLADQFANYGYLIVGAATFLENASGIGTLVPGDTVLLLAGYYTRGTAISLPVLILCGIGGAVLGDNVSYWIGRKGGRRLVDWLEHRWKFLHRRLTESQAYFRRHGGKTVLFGRNVALVRTYIPILAGVGRMRYPKFLLYNVAGATFQVTALLVIGYFFGQYRTVIERAFRNTTFALLFIVFVIVLIVWRRRAKKRRVR